MTKNTKYRFFSAFLALIIIYSTFQQAYVSVYFMAYQDYIVKELCVQKDNQKGCNGKCYLMKKLGKKVSENNMQTPPQNEIKEFKGNFILFLNKNSNHNFKYLADLESEKNIYYLPIKQSFFLEKETPPPKFFV